MATTSAGKNCLGEILGELEREKIPMSAFTKEEALIVCTKFASDVFDSADQIDRSGKANKSTAKSFYAAAVFFEILCQFDDPEAEEHKQKRLYAKWKATEILKAIKEGREIIPGGYAEQEENGTVTKDEDDLIPVLPTKDSSMNDKQDEGTEVDIYGTSIPPPPYKESVEEPLPQPEIKPVPVPTPVANVAPVSPKLAPTPTPAPTSPIRTSSIWNFGASGNSSKKVTKEQLEDAKELVRFALAALEARDADLGANRLQQALKALGR